MQLNNLAEHKMVFLTKLTYSIGVRRDQRLMKQ